MRPGLRRGAFASGESVVLYITGNAYKGGVIAPPLAAVIDPDADTFRDAYQEVLG